MATRSTVHVISTLTFILQVAGNREYYNDRGPDGSYVPNVTVAQIDADFRRMCTAKYSNVRFLNNEHFTLDNKYRFIGCTLWSYIPGPAQEYVRSHVPSYHWVLSRPGVPMTPEDSNKLNRKSVEYIRAKVKDGKAKGYVNIVLTHHTPSMLRTFKTQ